MLAAGELRTMREDGSGDVGRGRGVIDPIIDGCATIPSAVIIALILAHALCVRREAVLVGIYVAFSVVYGPARALLDPNARVIASVVVLCAQFVLFVAFPSQRPPAERVVITIAAFGCTALAEVIASTVFLFAGGTVEQEPARYYAVYCAARLVHIAVLALLLLLVDLFATRRLDGSRDTRMLGWFALFPATQFVLLAMLLYIEMSVSPFWHDEAWFSAETYAWFAALCGLCVVTDALYFRVMGRSMRARERRARADMLQEAIEGELAQCESAVLDAEAAALLRHDLANHLAVLRQLVADGNRAAALDHVREMTRMMEEGGGGRDVCARERRRGQP